MPGFVALTNALMMCRHASLKTRSLSADSVRSPLEVDVLSRGCHLAWSQKASDNLSCLLPLPEAIRTDNGVPFAASTGLIA